MKLEEIKSKIFQILRNQLYLPKSERITSESTLETLGADSLDTIQVAMTFEEVFGIDISDEVLDSWKTVQDIIDYVYKEKGK